MRENEGMYTGDNESDHEWKITSISKARGGKGKYKRNVRKYVKMIDEKLR